MGNWFSTDMSIRGESIDGTKLEGFLLQEDNKIIGLVTYIEKVRVSESLHKISDTLLK